MWAFTCKGKTEENIEHLHKQEFEVLPGMYAWPRHEWPAYISCLYLQINITPLPIPRHSISFNYIFFHVKWSFTSPSPNSLQLFHPYSVLFCIGKWKLHGGITLVILFCFIFCSRVVRRSHVSRLESLKERLRFLTTNH